MFSNRIIKVAYLGLPKRFQSSVLWVGREFRTNPLSHEEGGSDVVVEYYSDEVFGYDWIKFPSKYMEKIFCKRINVEKEEFDYYDRAKKLATIKREIKSIYARKRSKKSATDYAPFKEVWNNNDYTNTPWENLKNYDYSYRSKVYA